MFKVKFTRTAVIAASVLYSSCASKEGRVDIFSDNVAPTLSESDVNGNMHTSLTVSKKSDDVHDSLPADSVEVSDCYRWDREYLSSTPMTTEKGEPYDLNILFTLQESATDHYTGGMVLYVDEDDFVEATIEGLAQGNHITIYYVEDEQNTTGELFRNHDKLVTFDIQEGEYHARWYSPMHKFVDENTVLSIK